MHGTASGWTGRGMRGAMAAALLATACALGGCSISLSDMPLLGGGDSSDKPKEASTYPAVNDLPADRDEAVLAPAERNKIEQELIAARERQAAANANANANAAVTPAAAQARTAASK